MAAHAFDSPLPPFFDTDGRPLTSGYVYFGVANADPRTSPIAVFFDEALSAPAAQPLRTNAGYMTRNGAPTNVWIDGDYSVMVLDSKLQQVYYVASWRGVDHGLRQDLAASTGSSLVGHIASGASAAIRLVRDKVREIVSFKDYNNASGAQVTGDGVTDDVTGVQAAISATQGTGTALFMNPGTFLISAALSVTAALTLYGAGNTSSVLKLNSTTQDGIVVATTGKMTFSGFQVQGKATATAGNLISLDSGTGVDINQFSSFRDIWFQSGWKQLTTVSAATWMVDNCLFFSPLNTGVTIADVAHTDAGDMTIMGCIFSGQAATGTAISQASAGGLRLIGCKIIQFNAGYVLSLAAGVSTSDLFICGNSMEAFTSSAILLARGGGNVFGAVQITGNEISGALVCINMSGDAGPWMSHMEIVGNNFGFSLGGTGLAIVGTQDFIISGNTINGSGTGTGISLGAVVSKGIITQNTILACTLPISNGSAATDIIIKDNIGYNPVGASTLAPGASPWTFTTGPTPTTLYLSASTSITAVSINTTSILPVATGVNGIFTVELGPNEVAQVTYTGVLTAKKMVH